MSWHFLQGQEEASWEESSLDGAPSALSSLIPTPDPSCSHDSVMDILRGSRSGTMSQLLMDEPGGAESLSLVADSHVRTSVQPEKAPDLKGSDRVYGWKWPESLARFDLSTRSWKTRQCLLLGGSELYSEIWPRWGTMRNGEFWERTTSEDLISATGSGSLHATPAEAANKLHTWPTPTATQAGSIGMIGQMRRAVETGLTTPEEARSMVGGSLSPPRMSTWSPDKISDQLILLGVTDAPQNRQQTFPTPVCVGMRGGSGTWKTLLEMIHAGQVTTEEAKAMNGGSMPQRFWPTPVKADTGRRRKSANWQGTDLVCQVTEYEEASGTQLPKAGGQLNPEWVAWLMAWPIGWTALDALATARWRQWLQAHSEFCCIDSNASDAIEP